MGKGDLKTRRGKIARGTYGKTRSKKIAKSLVPNEKSPLKQKKKAKK